VYLGLKVSENILINERKKGKRANIKKIAKIKISVIFSTV
jgi:hypothetical protein